MTTFAPHRDTLESFVDCINGAADEGVDTDALSSLLAEDVVIYGPFGDEPVSGRETVVETIRSVNGIFFVLLDADSRIAEVNLFYRTLPAGVALQRNIAAALGWQPWELHTNGG